MCRSMDMSKSAVLAATKLKQSLKDPEELTEYASIQRHICIRHYHQAGMVLLLSRLNMHTLQLSTESAAHASSKVDGVP